MHLRSILDASWRLRWPRGAEGHTVKQSGVPPLRKFPRIAILFPVFEGDISYDSISTAIYPERQRTRNEEDLKDTWQYREKPYRETGLLGNEKPAHIRPQRETPNSILFPFIRLGVVRFADTSWCHAARPSITTMSFSSWSTLSW